MKFSSTTNRRPDALMEEIVTSLLCSKSFEFKALFSIVHEGLLARNAAHGGQEMLRLRTYDKLQTLVREGRVTKTGKKYKGVRKGLLILEDILKNPVKHLPFPKAATAPSKLRRSGKLKAVEEPTDAEF